MVAKFEEVFTEAGSEWDWTIEEDGVIGRRGHAFTFMGAAAAVHQLLKDNEERVKVGLNRLFGHNPNATPRW